MGYKSYVRYIKLLFRTGVSKLFEPGTGWPSPELLGGWVAPLPPPYHHHPITPQPLPPPPLLESFLFQAKDSPWAGSWPPRGHIRPLDHSLPTPGLEGPKVPGLTFPSHSDPKAESTYTIYLTFVSHPSSKVFQDRTTPVVPSWLCSQDSSVRWGGCNNFLLHSVTWCFSHSSTVGAAWIDNSQWPNKTRVRKSVTFWGLLDYNSYQA